MRRDIGALSLAAALLGWAACDDNNPAAGSRSLYEKYGGAFTVSKLVDDAIIIVQRDCVVAPYFRSTLERPGGSERLKSCLRLQFTALMGGPATYPGANDRGETCRDMTSAHAGQGIPGAVFDQFIADLVHVLQTNGVSQQDIDTLAPPLLALKPQIVSTNPVFLSECR